MNKKGFTIIELVVVIAIIAVLAAIVLINVAGYINKGKDAKMKETMHTLQVNAIGNGPATGASYDTTTGINGVCSTTAGSPWKTITTDFTSNTACNVTASAFCACVKELGPSTATYFCVDSTGKSADVTTDCTGSSYCGSTSAPVCPAS